MSEIGLVEFARHVHAVQRTVESGFVFSFLRDDAGAATTLRGVRRRYGLVDIYTVRGSDYAAAARYRADDYHRGDGIPLWQVTGAVLDVLGELLALPAHESRELST